MGEGIEKYDYFCLVDDLLAHFADAILLEECFGHLLKSEMLSFPVFLVRNHKYDLYCFLEPLIVCLDVYSSDMQYLNMLEKIIS